MSGAWSMITSLPTSSGDCSARAVATVPPSEWPTTVALADPEPAERLGDQVRLVVIE